MIIEFGSACLSEYDLDIVSPLDISRYSAPEILAGGVSAASDWWSLDIILLEQLTLGRCFEQIHTNAFLIQIMTHSVTIPDDLDENIRILLRGLLTRDRKQQWLCRKRRISNKQKLLNGMKPCPYYCVGSFSHGWPE
ncbi:protein kinase domain-containing protein [Xenorhabdus sp. Sc-CR9]|uniref:protein kinase domain-containing protein n=1 Tax=Xenorhabdus sp. Sc-CR9 TaxID=2584468 RepID=UPI001F40C03B